MPSSYWFILILPILLRLLRINPAASREKLLTPKEERVVLLGASSGVGKDLAHAYAKRGARICLLARRKQILETVRDECVALGLPRERILIIDGDISDAKDLMRVREAVCSAWQGLDTLHIIAGITSTSPVHDISGVNLTSVKPRIFSSSGPTQEGLDHLAKEARTLSEVNYIGTVLSLGCFLPLLASSSPSPALHHLSSVAATIPAPTRALYSATKSAALMVVESIRVECEGCGVRFFSLLPGTIDNDFRKSRASAKVDENFSSGYDHLLLRPEQVVETILSHLSLNPAPQPLIPYYPFAWINALKIPPKSVVHLPFQYRVAFWMWDTPLGWLVGEKAARRKYGLPA